MNTKAVALMFLTTWVMAFAQVFYKMSSTQVHSLAALLGNWQLIVGLLLYGLASLLLILSLRMDKLSTLYPFMSLSYIWVLLLAFVIFGEALHLWKIIGVVLIMVGVSYVGWGNRRTV